MNCPKCMGRMRQYERSGVVVDQCAECRGIFLDRGELEKLIDAEAAFNGRRAEEPRRDDQRRGEYRRDEHRQHGYDQHRQRKKKHSFFEELFD